MHIQEHLLPVKHFKLHAAGGSLKNNLTRKQRNDKIINFKVFYPATLTADTRNIIPELRQQSNTDQFQAPIVSGKHRTPNTASESHFHKTKTQTKKTSHFVAQVTEYL